MRSVEEVAGSQALANFNGSLTVKKNYRLMFTEINKTTQIDGK